MRLSISEAKPEPAQESERRAPGCHFSPPTFNQISLKCFCCTSAQERAARASCTPITEPKGKIRGREIVLDSRRSLKEREISGLVLCFNGRFKGKRQREDQSENLWKTLSSRNSEVTAADFII